MSLHVLDTDIASLFREGNSAVTQRVLAHSEEELAITVITVEEMLAGWYQKLRQPNTPERLESIYAQITRTLLYIRQFQILSYTVATHLRFQELQALKLNVGAFDLRIASVVLEADAILVTRNLRDFQRVPGLTIENWAL